MRGKNRKTSEKLMTVSNKRNKKISKRQGVVEVELKIVKTLPSLDVN